MSRYVTPFLVVNLGAEMVFVVAQRLQAQGVDHERSAIVLDEIIAVLVSQQLITEIVKPQAAYSHQALKDLVEDVAQSSLMRLDTKSMDKLWDLITMVFKWQITLSSDLLKLTQRHLYEIENYVTHESTQLQLHKVQNIFDNFAKILSATELIDLRNGVIDWLKDFHVRVSLLLRIGLQDGEGRFVVDNLCPFAEDMLRNLGENIYSVTQNGGLLRDDNDAERKTADDANENRNEALELEMLAGQLKGTPAGASAGSSTSNVLKLSINAKDTKSASHFDAITTRTGNANNGNVELLDDMFGDLRLSTVNAANDNDNDNLNEDLINMIESEAN